MRIALCRIVRIALCCIVFEDTRLPVIVHDIFAKARFVIDLKLMFVGPPLDSRISQCSQCGCSPPYCLTMVAKRPAAGRNEADTVTNRAPGVWWWCHQRPVLTSSFARSEWKSWHIAATRNERCTGHMRSARWKNQHLVFPPKSSGFRSFISCLEVAHVTPTAAETGCCESDAIFVCAAGAGGGRSRQTLLKRFGYLEMASIQIRC